MVQRVALITGGDKGIGKALGARLASDGWAVAFCYRSDEQNADDVQRSLRDAGAKAMGVRCDVSDVDACQGLVDHVLEQWGRIDALIHCAGPYHRGPLMEETVAGWHEMFDNNLHPVFYLSRQVAPAMAEQRWGRILTFGMANADRMVAQPNITGHYIAKAAVLMLTRTLAKVLGPDQITVNSISPGYLNTGSAPAEELEAAVQSIPAGYVGEISDAVDAACYLLSDEARYVNGANLQLSGGWGV